VGRWRDIDMLCALGFHRRRRGGQEIPTVDEPGNLAAGAFVYLPAVAAAPGRVELDPAPAGSNNAGGG